MTNAGEPMISGWAMTAAGAPFERITFAAPLAAGELLVEVAGCGVCHTDISFLHLGVKTRKGLPLVLGHEVSGIVRQVGEGIDEGLIGRPVLVPAVLPCGRCELCRSGNRTICRAQVMPGNDRHGGFASHLSVPAVYVCPIPESVLARHELWQLAVVADAVTTPFMAVKRSGLAEGELAIVIGVGGIGIHCVQIAAAAGAKVIAMDIDPRKLELARSYGARAAIDVTGLSEKDVRNRVRQEVKTLGGPEHLWKIFETSGTKPGQETAFNLLGFGGYLSIVGFTMDRLEVRLSNLMAFDATLRGNWGCDPTLYPEVLEWIGAGRIAIAPFVKRFPLDEINDVFDAAHHGKLLERAVLVPGDL